MAPFTLRIDEQHPLNAKVVRYLRGRFAQNFPPCAATHSVPDPYIGLGSHPEIVERVWDQLGTVLPVDCRCIVYGTPALIAPRSGVILAVAIGTRYGMRLPAQSVAESIRAGARTVTQWSDGGETDIQREFGNDWVFGSWLKQEPKWLREVYNMVERL